jgi:hypothetical protein
MSTTKRVLGLLGATTFVAGLVIQVLSPLHASAAQITARSLTLQAGASDGGSKPGGVVNHLFAFTLPAVGNPNVGSIKFEYCTTAANDSVTPTCVTPTGLDTTSAALGSENGFTGLTLNNTTNGAPYLFKASASSVTAGTAVTYQLQSITNPTTEGTFFVRISTYASSDTTGSAIDTGTVAASTTEQIILTGTMPESLVFCTGETVGTTAGVPDCATATAGSITFNRLFSPTDTATTSSQMAASTNAGSGYAITVNGATLTSGSNTITAMGAAALGVRGTSQFGLNLKANTTTTSNPAVGAEVSPINNATNYKGQAYTGYNTVDNFKFTNGDVVARSDDPSLGATDAQIFTASYIVNVPGSQPAGTYTSTLTYICTPTY